MIKMIISASRRTDIPAFYSEWFMNRVRDDYCSSYTDGDYIKKVFNIDVSRAKDKYQRKECGCIESNDIGIYDTCLHGCKYCYANRSDSVVMKNHKEHRNDSPSLSGWYECRKEDKI